MTLRLESPTKRARSNRAAIDCRSKAACDENPLLLLNGLQIIDDRAHVLRRENELRHVGVTSRKALGQSLGKAFDLVFVRERSERRRGHGRAGAGAADGMAARTICRQQQLAASCRRSGVLCQGGRSHTHCDHRDETMKGLPAHMLFACARGSAWPRGCGNKEQNGQPRFDMAQIRKRLVRWSQRHRVAQDALEASAFGSSIPAIKAMRTRSERLAACILIMRLAR